MMEGRTHADTGRTRKLHTERNQTQEYFRHVKQVQLFLPFAGIFSEAALLFKRTALTSVKGTHPMISLGTHIWMYIF